MLISAGGEKWDLQRCLDYAKTNNIQLNTLRLSQEISKETLLQAKAAMYPSLNGGMTQTYVHSNGANAEIAGTGSSNNFTSGYSLGSSWTVFNLSIEAILISVTGGLIGVLLGITATRLVTLFLHWPTLIMDSSIILSFLVCALTGIFFGWYPAQKASGLDPIEALHYE